MPFKIYLVNKANVSADTLAVTRTTLTSYYTKIAAAAGTTFSGISVVTHIAPIGSKDLLCYMVPGFSSSVVIKYASNLQGDGNVTGNTACSTDINESASEVYLDVATRNADNLGRMLANIIFHEFMHNKECAEPDLVHDQGGDGLAGATGIKDSMDISAGNITFMKPRIIKDIKQWTGGF